MAKEEMVNNNGNRDFPGYMRFVIGGLSGMCATAIIQPLDMLKNRMQLSGELGKKKDHKSTIHAVKNIINNEGPLALYKGLSANLMRQASYTTTRLGFYQWSVEKLKMDGHEGFMVQIGCGLLAGAVGSVVGAPTDIALVRMLSDGRLHPSQRRNYTNVGNAIVRIAREEGFFRLWRGLVPSASRAMVGTSAQLVSYTQAKQYIISNGYLEDKTFCHFVCSLISGLVYTVLSNPLDLAKTRIQSMKTLEKPLYSGVFDVWKKTVQKEGVSGLWKGLSPYYLRMGPHTTFILIFSEKFTYYYSFYILGIENPKGL